MKTADPELMRAINRFHVLDTIRRTGTISRVEIGARTQLSATTISAITASLLDDELITPHHEGDIRAENGSNRGRPRVMLTLNASAARVVGAKIATNGLVFVVTDFRQTEPFIGNREIAEAAFFPVDGLPGDTTAGTRRRIREAVFGEPPSPYW